MPPALMTGCCGLTWNAGVSKAQRQADDVKPRPYLEGKHCKVKYEGVSYTGVILDARHRGTYTKLSLLFISCVAHVLLLCLS